jgi:TatA/E family protein of Tat protein translocase
VFLGEIFGMDGVIVVVVVGVLLFGGAAIPKLAKNLGSAKSEFEKGLRESKRPDTSADTPETLAETRAPDTDK